MSTKPEKREVLIDRWQKELKEKYFRSVPKEVLNDAYLTLMEMYADKIANGEKINLRNVGNITPKKMAYPNLSGVCAAFKKRLRSHYIRVNFTLSDQLKRRIADMTKIAVLLFALLLPAAPALAKDIMVVCKDGSIIDNVQTIEAQGDHYIFEFIRNGKNDFVEYPADHVKYIEVNKMRLVYTGEDWMMVGLDGWKQRVLKKEDNDAEKNKLENK